MEIHPSCLKDNQEYIIETKYNEDNYHIFKGMRKVTSIDSISEDGLYKKVHFVNIEKLVEKMNLDTIPKITPAKLVRSTNLNSEYFDILKQNGQSFDVDDNTKFYDKETFIFEQENEI